MNNISYYISKNITKTQIILCVIAIGLVFLLILGTMFIYTPSKKRIEWLKTQTEKLSRSLILPRSLIQKGNSIDSIKKLLDENKKDFLKNFPAKEDESMALISDVARNNSLEVVSVRAETRETIPEATMSTMKDFVLQRIAVNVELKGKYEDLIKYLNKLNSDIPAYVVIEQLKIQSIKDEPSKLDISMQIILLLSR